jgi:hypothetical protein
MRLWGASVGEKKAPTLPPENHHLFVTKSTNFS